MKRGFKCRNDVLKNLKHEYDRIVHEKYNGVFLDGLKNFNNIAEDELRQVLLEFYENARSRDQAWKTCKGSLYEYAVYRYITQIIENNESLKRRLIIRMGDEALDTHGDQIAIKNWCDIFPDVDILIIDKDTQLVKAILSCKTSLRERLTETAFWKREFEKTKELTDIKVIFITPDKDNELKTETNRYILLHVIDYTFITDPERYESLIKSYRKKYGDRDDFGLLLDRVKSIDDMKKFFNKVFAQR